jgi:CheY-like chemotaxis protein
VSPDRDRHPRLGPENEHRRTPAPGGSGLHILVAEDDPVTAATLALVLRRDGHRVQLAPDGPTAVERAQEQPPDVVLLDINLPGLDGWEVARRLPPPPHALAKRPFLIAVSGSGMGADPRRCREAGIDLLLAKPVDLGLLRWVLRRFQRLLLPGDAPPEEPG